MNGLAAGKVRTIDLDEQVLFWGQLKGKRKSDKRMDIVQRRGLINGSE